MDSTHAVVFYLGVFVGALIGGTFTSLVTYAVMARRVRMHQAFADYAYDEFKRAVRR